MIKMLLFITGVIYYAKYFIIYIKSKRLEKVMNKWMDKKVMREVSVKKVNK